MAYLAAFDTLVGAICLAVGADDFILGLDLRAVGLLLQLQIQLLSIPHPVDLVGRVGIILVASSGGPPLCVKGLGAAVVCPVDADG